LKINIKLRCLTGVTITRKTKFIQHYIWIRCIHGMQYVPKTSGSVYISIKTK